MLTPAGRKLISQFCLEEAAGRLFPLKDGRTGETFYGMALEAGNGGQKAAAEKLARDGYAKVQWTRSLGSHRGRYFWLTKSGRESAFYSAGAYE